MIERDTVNIGVLGAGGVGGSVLELFYSSPGRLSEAAGIPINIRRVLVRDPQKPRAVTLPKGILTTGLDDVVNDPDINLVVSLLGNEDAERSAIASAMMQGKYVVTANKVVVANMVPSFLELPAKMESG